VQIAPFELHHCAEKLVDFDLLVLAQEVLWNFAGVF
jgi:hypothetical protein